MRASELKGKPVLCLTRGRRIGSVQTVLLDPVEGRIAGLRVRTGLLEPSQTVTADLIHSVCPDAVTVDTGRGVSPGLIDHLARLPDLGQLSRIHVVTASGESIGPIRDALIDPLSLTIVGYEVARSPLDELLHGRLVVLVGERISYGDGVLVVPDEAVGRGAALGEDRSDYYY